MGDTGVLIAAVATLIGAIALLLKVFIQVIDKYVKKPEDIRLAEVSKDAEYYKQRAQELEAKLADAALILIEFPKLRDEVSKLRKEVEELRPRVMEFEKLTNKHHELQASYDSLQAECIKLRDQVCTYEKVFTLLDVKPKEISNGTSININSDPTGSSSTGS
jgi:predicted  nucleic acid-binding Zn-ribbon protein